jgi:hypothetical protein
MSSTAQKSISGPRFNIETDAAAVDVGDDRFPDHSRPDASSANVLNIDFCANGLFTGLKKRPQSFSPRAFHEQNHIGS